MYWGDYPQYIESIYETLEEPYEITDLAMKKGRENSALVLLEKESERENIINAMRYRCEKCLKYLITKFDLEDVIIDDVLFGGSYLSDSDFLWALEKTNHPVSERLITAYLSATEAISSKLLEALLARATDEEVGKAHKQHLKGVKSGISYYGGDYFYGEEVSKAF